MEKTKDKGLLRLLTLRDAVGVDLGAIIDAVIHQMVPVAL